MHKLNAFGHGCCDKNLSKEDHTIYTEFKVYTGFTQTGELINSFNIFETAPIGDTREKGR